jgi:hypothetical protein
MNEMSFLFQGPTVSFGPHPVPTTEVLSMGSKRKVSTYFGERQRAKDDYLLTFVSAGLKLNQTLAVVSPPTHEFSKER